MKRLLCKLRGHRWNEIALQNGVNHCEFCDYCDWGIHAYEWTLRDKIDHWIWGMKHRVKFYWRRVKWILTKDKDDQLPF